MVKYFVGLIVLIIIAVGMLLPAFQQARESNCGQRNREGGGLELEQGSPENMTKQSNDQQQVSSWPNDVASLVEQLNGWHRDELILFNEPQAFPNKKPSGETGGWIGSHIEEIKKLGTDVTWDKLQKKYVVIEEE